MSDWQQKARAATARYRGHPDYEDLLQVAMIAAWQAPEYAYLAAQRETRTYLASSLNRVRTFNQQGAAVPELLGLLECDEEWITGRQGDPEREAVGRVWVEWCLSLSSLTMRERQLLTLWLYSGESQCEIARREGRHISNTCDAVARAARKIRAAMAGEAVALPDYPSRQEEAAVCALAREGLPAAEIARRCGRHRTTVAGILDRHGEGRPRRAAPLTDAEREEIVKLRAAGFSFSEIEARTGRGAASVWRSLERNRRRKQSVEAQP